MLTVSTLGRFRIADEKGILNEEDIRSAKLTKLLLCLIVHRNRTLTLDEIASLLWHEEETANPAGALKNLTYRLRNMLRQFFGETQLILTGRGSYRINPEVEICVDVEQFEQMYHQVKQKRLSWREKMQYLKQMTDFYQGDFMAGVTDVHWIAAMNTYYRSLFFSCVKELAELYKENGFYDELEELCNHALEYENAEEEFHYYLIFARMKKNKKNLAMESYHGAKRVLSEELGITKSEKLQRVYQELLRQKNREEQEYLLFFTVSADEKNESSQMTCGTIEPGTFKVKAAMKHLETILRTSLRASDAVSKYSDCQYAIQLFGCSKANGELVAKRIISKFYEGNERFLGLKVTAKFESITRSNQLLCQGGR